MRSTKILFRLDAGKKVGYGHLSRNIALCDSLINQGFFCKFLIKTDDKQNVTEFIGNKSQHSFEFLFIPFEIPEKTELEVLISEYERGFNFFVLDHYSISLDYQLFLLKNGVRWLQFDSFATSDIFADIVVSASPSANDEVYKSICKKDEPVLLLGPKYALLGSEFMQLHLKSIVRNSVNKVFICFGGGNDFGASLNLIEIISNAHLSNINFNLFIGKSNPFQRQIKSAIKHLRNFGCEVGKNNLAQYMQTYDMAIISPGTLSYEAACMGLPMMMITTASNQNMNAYGWEKIGCGKYFGHFDCLHQDEMIYYIKDIKKNTEKLSNMSEKCLNTVDGLGAKRITKNIMACT